MTTISSSDIADVTQHSIDLGGAISDTGQKWHERTDNAVLVDTVPSGVGRLFSDAKFIATHPTKVQP